MFPYEAKESLSIVHGLSCVFVLPMGEILSRCDVKFVATAT